ncbi:hypothetical protein IE996_22935 [Klebsiella pneumoniae]|uniref:Uncharacterized protein n=1 Tax=Klebsiella pneumoniae TaxID=573 RepID=A0A927DQX8_KLEPN|nr:hypothetical protein [Klebsiella pneumoniae]
MTIVRISASASPAFASADQIPRQTVGYPDAVRIQRRGADAELPPPAPSCPGSPEPAPVSPAGR